MSTFVNISDCEVERMVSTFVNISDCEVEKMVSTFLYIRLKLRGWCLLSYISD